MKLFIRIFILFLVPTLSYAESPIKIGTFLHLTGDYGMVGTAFHEGIEVAVEEINSSGGVDGRPIKLILDDTAYNMKNVHSISKKYIELDKVPAAIVSNYTEVMVAGPAFERAKTPLIVIWDSAPEIEDLGDYVFGIGIWTPSTSDVAVKFAMEKLNAKTAVTISSNGEWSLGVAESFREKFEKAGGKILDYHAVNPSDSDFRTLLLKVSKLNPDVLYAPVSDNIPAFFSQLHQSQYKNPTITSDIVSDEIIKTVGNAIEGVYQTQPANPDFPATKKMLKLYKKKYSKDCTQVPFTALGYDALHLMAKAMKEKGTDKEQIKEGLYSITDYEGASGKSTITPEGSVRRRVQMFQVRGGTLKLIK